MNNLPLPDCDFLEYLKMIGEQESQELLPPSAFKSEALDYAVNGLQVSGPPLPWSKVSDVIRVRPGQLSIWGGRSGAGKSVIVNQNILWRLQNQKAVIASLEMRPEQTLYKMACQAAGCQPSSAWFSDWLDHLEGRLWIYDQLDTVNSNRILGMIHYVFAEMDVDHVVIDSLTKCGFRRDDYTGQAEFINRLQLAAKRYNKHIHLVCHMRKSDGNRPSDGKDEIRGAGEITDLADNLFILSRNRAKEESVRRKKRKMDLTEKDQDRIKQPDAYLAIGKNREYGEEPTFSLWFHPQSQQFIPSDANKAMYCPTVHQTVDGEAPHEEKPADAEEGLW